MDSRLRDFLRQLMHSAIHSAIHAIFWKMPLVLALLALALLVGAVVYFQMY